MSVRDAIDFTVEEPGGSRGNPLDLSANNAENQATEANHNVQITQQELEILQEEVFEKRESTHRKITKMTTKRLEKLLERVENGE
jgi:aspartate aminotransferase-like enzyme